MMDTSNSGHLKIGLLMEGMPISSRAREVLLPTARLTVKKGKINSWNPAIQAVMAEIASLVTGMNDGAKKCLLHAVIWDAYWREQDKAAAKGNKPGKKI